MWQLLYIHCFFMTWHYAIDAHTDEYVVEFALSYGCGFMKNPFP